MRLLLSEQSERPPARMFNLQRLAWEPSRSPCFAGSYCHCPRNRFPQRRGLAFWGYFCELASTPFLAEKSVATLGVAIYRNTTRKSLHSSRRRCFVGSSRSHLLMLPLESTGRAIGNQDESTRHECRDRPVNTQAPFTFLPLHATTRIKGMSASTKVPHIRTGEIKSCMQSKNSRNSPRRTRPEASVYRRRTLARS